MEPHEPPAQPTAPAHSESPRPRWWALAAPLLVYTLLGVLEPKPLAQEDSGAAAPAQQQHAKQAVWTYPRFYAVRLGVTAAVLLGAWPAYRRFPWRITPLGVGVGLVGAAAWIGLRHLRLEEALLAAWGGESWSELTARPAFNPFAAFPGDTASLAGFLTVRFLGLVLVVPLIEEIFLRGFLMQWVVQEAWWQVPFGQVTRLAALTAVAYGVLAHPGEWLAAAVWFSLVTWLMHKTRSLGDCVAAHATTNLLLGVYVVAFGHWWLW